jgi:ankyrin repeat protein
MVAAHRRQIGAAKALIAAKADLNLLDVQAYDVITIAAVIDDVDMVNLAIASGGNARAVTSPYKGTALIAAAHLGHAEVVQALIAGGAPLDHINNLGWTALIEAIVLGDGGARHQATVAALVKAGVDSNLPDKQGVKPLTLARTRGYAQIARMLQEAGAKP